MKLQRSFFAWMLTVFAAFFVAGAVIEISRSYRDHAITKAENAELRLGRNRRDRAASNFALPGFTGDHLERITRTAEIFGTPWQMAAALYKSEQGGDLLEFGIQDLPSPLMLTYRDPKDHQFAGIQRMLTQEAFDLIMGDVSLRARFLSEFVRRHGPAKPMEYGDQLTAFLNGYLDGGKPSTKPLLPTRERRRSGHNRDHGKSKEARP